MKLEYQKHRLSRYFKTIIICILSIFIAVALMAWGSRNESETMFPNFDEFMFLSNILIRIVFMIFSGVLLSRLVIGEYQNKTMQLLFTYPLKRKKIMQAKLTIVFLFCFFSIFLATLVVGLLAFIVSPYIYLVDETIYITNIMSTIPSAILSALMMAGVCLIPLFFGMRKKSTSSTVTWAVLVGFLINGTVSNGEASVNLYQFIAIPISFCLLGLFVAYITYRNVDKTDLA